MTAAEFLRTLWPDTGVYAIATPFLIPEAGVRTYRHRTFETIEAAAAFATHAAAKEDVYFAVHSLLQPRVWNPTKIDRRTGEPGAYEVRTQANMAAAKAFFFDLDVGVAGHTPKYESQLAALTDLKRFCQVALLPKPMIVSSGGGLHVYWPLDTLVDSREWRQHAHRLRTLAKHHGLKADPARTTDSASVLRVAGTFNHKDPAHPRAVRVLQAGTVTPLATFLSLVDAALVRAGRDVAPLPVFTGDSTPVSALGDLGGNLDGDLYDGPAVSFKALVAACPQMQRQVRKQGNTSEPEWYHTINLVRFVENGRHYIEKLAQGSPYYDPTSGWIDQKLTQLTTKRIKPTSCQKLAEVCGDDACLGCPFAGKVKSPIVAARYKDLAPAPTLTVTAGPAPVTLTIPDPPAPYKRLKVGGVVAAVKNGEGEDEHRTIYAHDLYPIRRLVNAATATEQHLWCVTLPRTGPKEFLLDADALYDRRKFASAIANHGVFPTAANIPYLQEYMTAYIAELQRQADAETQCTHLGWTDNQTRFILPDKILDPSGTARPAMLGLGAARSAAQVHTRGTLAEQVRLLKFYEHPAYIPNQFMLLASLAAPIFHATGHHGVIVNASGDAGSSKSTTLYTAASFWGQPELYPINGTNNGATVRGRNERITVLANLPICVDEITNMTVKDAVDLAMSITQPGHRIRLEQSGVERASTESYKATIMLATANNSLHGLLSTDNAAGTAGSMRVVEVRFQAQTVHAKHEADEFWHQLKQHYGHIGEVFMQHVVQHHAAVQARVREVMKGVDLAGRIQSSERFWSATIASVLVAGEIARSLGLLPFDVRAIEHWAIHTQIPYMRGVVVEEYASPLATLADYLEAIHGHILITQKMPGGTGMVNVLQKPHGALLARYDIEEKTLWVLKKGFKDYCTRSGANALKILDELFFPTVGSDGRPVRVLASKHTRRTLGAGTEYAKAQSWCFAVNMTHPDVTGALPAEIVAAVPSKVLQFPQAQQALG